MIVVRILGWNTDRAWVEWREYHRTDLEWRLGRLMDLDRVAIKRLARQIRDRQCNAVPLSKASDRFAAESLRSFLESLGAEATVEDA